MLSKRICEHSFFDTVLTPESVVVDLGANYGEFSKRIVEDYGSTVYAAEPVPDLFNNLPKLDKYYPDCVAISDTEGELTINVYDERCASTISAEEAGKFEAITVKTITLAAFFEKFNLGYVDLLKVDIEGAELGMFKVLPDEFFDNIGQITIEFHDFIYPDLTEPTIAAIERLEGLGFYRINFSNDRTDVLFINREKSQISNGVLWFHKFVVKYWRGIGRILKRQLS